MGDVRIGVLVLGAFLAAKNTWLGRRGRMEERQNAQRLVASVRQPRADPLDEKNRQVVV